MTVETDKLCDDLRSWTRSPSIGLVEYSDDPTIQRRVGIMLSKYASKLSSGSKETDLLADMIWFATGIFGHHCAKSDGNTAISVDWSGV